MIAAKAFDPVLGIDIHIIQPPGPVPPVPVPHPFIGILIDPFDFAPIIGSTVDVNGLPRATAGTGWKCLPPHITSRSAAYSSNRQPTKATCSWVRRRCWPTTSP